ncbi:MAG: DUF3311 domain-containing protein [Methyloceanibacter sp.]|nr:DUF3311 domain-containing protein [Methyloceanibacter sp.]
MRTKEQRAAAWRYWPRLLLIIPFALVAWVPFYNRIEPTLWGIPFFYWYQLAAIILGAMVVMGVYFLDRRAGFAADGADRRSEQETDDGTGPGGAL